MLALFLGLIVSAGLYFAYLWPAVEPQEESMAEPVALAADSLPARDDDTDDVDVPATATDAPARPQADAP